MNLMDIRYKLLREIRRFRYPQIAYWHDRFDQYGARAVLDLRHSENEMLALTTRQKNQIFPYVSEYLTGQEEIALDYGCGHGRFSMALAELIGGKTIAVDPVSGFLDIAPKSKQVNYRHLKRSKLPLENASVDLVWVCLVLGGISNKNLPSTIAELRRVMKPNAIVCLIENTSDLRSNRYWNYRSVAFYQELFSFCNLQHLSDYEDLKETNSILIGRSKE